jgi:hypothetical protein
MLASPASGNESRRKPPADYIGALIEVVADCEFRRDGACFDRVRIVEIMAQPAPPARQRVPGEDFFLVSGEPSEPREARNWRALVLAVPFSTTAEPIGYGATFMTLSDDEETIALFRKSASFLLGPGY